MSAISSTTDADLAQAATVAAPTVKVVPRPSLGERFREYGVRFVVVALGILVGWIVAVVIGSITGWIPFVC